MTIQQLRYFVSVAENLSFTETAQKLYIATSAISYGITSLETDLGVKLFDRKKRQVVLTREGEYLYGEAVRILKIVDNIYLKLNSFKSGMQDELTIGFLSSLLKPYFPELIVPFIHSHRDIKLSMQPMNLDPLMDALMNEEVDIALTRSFHLTNIDERKIGSFKIYEDCLGLLVYKGHPFAETKNTEDLSALKDDAFITVDPGVSESLYNTILRICANRNYTPNIKSTVSTMDNVFTLVGAHMGISVVPTFHSFYSSMPELCFIPLEGDDTRADVLVAWNHNNEKQVVKEFLKSFRK